jgi:glycine cleavage system regulatory protein
MTTSLVFTVIGPDRPGLVKEISDKVSAFEANWLESRMANLGGQFAGIVRVDVAAAKADALIAALREFEVRGLIIVASKGHAAAPDAPSRLLELDLVGQDHPGIVREISQVLASHDVSIEELVTDCESGSMSGETMFHAKARLRVPQKLDTAELRKVLEALADDLMVELTFDGVHAA